MSAPGPFSPKNRVALISGGAGYWGREMAWGLGEAGAALILGGQNGNRLSAVAAELAKAGISAECAAFDMMDFEAVRRFFSGRHRIDLLINNAVSMTPKSFDQAGPDDFDQTFPITVTAAFKAVRAARPALARAARETGDAGASNVATMCARLGPFPKKRWLVATRECRIQFRDRHGARGGRGLDGLVE